MADESATGAITFIGSISQSKNAISFGESIRLQLDIPEIYRAQAAALTAMRNKILSITIIPEADGRKVENKRSEW